MKNRVTSRDVAREAGVSQTMVSFVLNGAKEKNIKPETRTRVLEAAKRLGYRVNINAKNMRSRRASAIGIISGWQTSSFVFAPLIDGIRSVCSENDLSMVLCSGTRDEDGEYDFKKYYMQNRIDGVIFISYVGIKKDGIIAELIDSQIPFVCVKGARDIENISSIDVDYAQSAGLAVSYLAGRGYKNICYVLKKRAEELNYAEAERLESCIKAAGEHGIDLIQYGGFIGCETTEDFYSSADALLSSDISFDAFLSTSYECFCLMKMSARRGIHIPERIGVMSLDNENYSEFLYPSLTTTDEPLYSMGAKAMSMLLSYIKFGPHIEKEALSAEITVRESTK